MCCGALSKAMQLTPCSPRTRKITSTRPAILATSKLHDKEVSMIVFLPWDKPAKCPLHPHGQQVSLDTPCKSTTAQDGTDTSPPRSMTSLSTPSPRTMRLASSAKRTSSRPCFSAKLCLAPIRSRQHQVGGNAQPQRHSVQSLCWLVDFSRPPPLPLGRDYTNWCRETAASSPRHIEQPKRVRRVVLTIP